MSVSFDLANQHLQQRYHFCTEPGQSHKQTTTLGADLPNHISHLRFVKK